jgi:argininosuccinate lyase
MSIHYAHLVMLADRGIVSGGDAHALRAALDTVSQPDVKPGGLRRPVEDLFFHVGRLISAACGDETASRLHTARSRNDIDMTMYRMRQRELILALASATCELRRALIELSDGHRTTVFAVHAHAARPADDDCSLPSRRDRTARAIVRLHAAFTTTNRCPLGACAITGTGFPIDRNLTADCSALRAGQQHLWQHRDGRLPARKRVSRWRAADGLGRFVQDLLQWATAEFNYLRVGEVRAVQRHHAEAESGGAGHGVPSRARRWARPRRSSRSSTTHRSATSRHRGRSAATRLHDVR